MSFDIFFILPAACGMVTHRAIFQIFAWGFKNWWRPLCPKNSHTFFENQALPVWCVHEIYFPLYFLVLGILSVSETAQQLKIYLPGVLRSTIIFENLTGGRLSGRLEVVFKTLPYNKWIKKVTCCPEPAAKRHGHAEVLVEKNKEKGTYG